MIDADVHPSHGPQIAGLIAEKASGLPEHIGINNNAIKLVDANEFMRPFQSPVGAPILFERESDGSFRLCINYKSPYNVPGHVGFDGQNGHDSHVSLNGHDRSYAPRKAGKGLTLPEDFCWLTLAWVFTFSNADILCREGACLDELHGCGRLSGWNSSN